METSENVTESYTGVSHVRPTIREHPNLFPQGK